MLISIAFLSFCICFFYFFKKRFFFSLSHPWKDEKLSFAIAEIEDFSKKYSYFSHHPIIGKVSNSEKDLQITQDILHIIDRKIKNPKKRMIATAEILTKALAYRDLEVGITFFIPLTLKKRKNVLVAYSLNKVFNIFGGMPAFGLLPQTYKSFAAPILLFRGTDFSIGTKRGWASLLCDVDPKGPGFHAFLHIKDELRDWILKANRLSNCKTRVLGYSLGGVLASYSNIYYNDLFSSDVYQPSIAFNSPGVDIAAFRIWDKLSHDNKSLFINFYSQNDLISKYGHLIGYKYKLSSENNPYFIKAHVSLMTGNEYIDLIRM